MKLVCYTILVYLISFGICTIVNKIVKQKKISTFVTAARALATYMAIPRSA